MAFACPNCAAAMTSTSARGLWVHGCGACGGVWLDTTTADFVRTKTNREIAKLVADAAARATVGEQHRLRPCPVCRHPLGAFLHGRLQLDGCRTHGVFFDRNELRLMLEANAASMGAEASESDDGPSSSGGLGIALGIAAAIFLD
jgi:Zn-finger nucleic acid-binding protein